MGSTATLFAFLQKRPESAALISGFAGTRSVKKKTYQTDRFFGFEIPSGKASQREVEEFLIHPNAVKTLRVGECVRVGKYPGAGVARIKIHISAFDSAKWRDCLSILVPSHSFELSRINAALPNSAEQPMRMPFCYSVEWSPRIRLFKLLYCVFQVPAGSTFTTLR